MLQNSEEKKQSINGIILEKSVDVVYRRVSFVLQFLELVHEVKFQVTLILRKHGRVHLIFGFVISLSNILHSFL